MDVAAASVKPWTAKDHWTSDEGDLQEGDSLDAGKHGHDTRRLRRVGCGVRHVGYNPRWPVAFVTLGSRGSCARAGSLSLSSHLSAGARRNGSLARGPAWRTARPALISGGLLSALVLALSFAHLAGWLVFGKSSFFSLRCVLRAAGVVLVPLLPLALAPLGGLALGGGRTGLLSRRPVLAAPLLFLPPNAGCGCRLLRLS